MEEFMSFVETNYIWLIVIGIILVMALIGFIAEKLDYKKVKKPKKAPKEEPKKEEIKEVEEQEETPALDAMSFEIPTTEKDPVSEVTPTFDDLNIQPKEEDLNAPLTEDLSAPLEEVQPQEDLSTPLTEDLSAPVQEVQPMEEDLNVPLEGAEPVKEEKVEEVPQDLYAPISDTAEEKEEVLEVSDEKPVDAPLPDLDTIKEDQQTATSDDDIWNF